MRFGHFGRTIAWAVAAVLVVGSPARADVAAKAPTHVGVPGPTHVGVPGATQVGAGLAAHRFTLREATQLGATAGRDVLVARAPQGALADARRAADAILTTLPRATVQVGERRGAAGKGVEVGVTLMQDIPLGGLGGARRGSAEALGRVLAADVDRARIDAAARAATAWIGVAEADRVLSLRHASLGHASLALKLVSARVASGVAEPLDREIARGDEAAARAAVLDAEGLRFEAGMELAFAVGLPAGTPVDVVAPDADAEDAPVDEAALIKRADRDHPAVRLAEARQASAHRDADLAAASGIPAISVGASYTREGLGDHVWTGIVSVPLPFTRTWAFDAARQRMAAESAGAQAATARAELGREIRVALHEREHTREVHDALAHGALPPMREALRMAEAQLAAGALDVTRVLLARQRLLATEEMVAKSMSDVRRADVRLMRAAGTLIPAEGGR